MTSHDQEELRELSALASSALEMGDLEQAEDLYRSLLNFEREVKGEDSPSQLGMLKILVRLLLLRGEVKESVAWLEKALVITASVYGGEHENTAAAMTTLASAMRKRSDSFDQEEAENVYGQALQILYALHRGDGSEREEEGEEGGGGEAALERSGRYTASLAAALVGMGMCLEAQGKYDEAKVQFEEALVLRRRLYGQQHPETGDVLLCLASLLARTDATNAAAIRYEQALRVFQGEYGPHHARVQLVRDSLATLMKRQAKELWSQKLFGEACVASTASDRGCPGAAIVSGYFFKSVGGVMGGTSRRKIFAALYPEAGHCVVATSGSGGGGGGGGGAGAVGSINSAERGGGGGGGEGGAEDPLVLIWAYDADLSTQGRALPGMTLLTSVWKAATTSSAAAAASATQSGADLYGEGVVVQLEGARGVVEEAVAGQAEAEQILRVFTSSSAATTTLSRSPSEHGPDTEAFFAHCTKRVADAFVEALTFGHVIDSD